MIGARARCRIGFGFLPDWDGGLDHPERVMRQFADAVQWAKAEGPTAENINWTCVH